MIGLHCSIALARGVDTLQVQVRLFAGIAEALGQSQLDVELSDQATVSNLKMTLVTGWPELQASWQRALIAVNREYADDDTAIQSSDEVAVIPPVGGGSGDVQIVTNQSSCLISGTPLSIDLAYQFLTSPEFGGTTVFVGRVREWTGMRQTGSIIYEAYAEMAVAQMAQIAEQVGLDCQPSRMLMWHRVGDLAPTDIAVICGAATPHRAAAFQACRLLIDRLKQEVPIWKQEMLVDGTQEWRENP